jgi:hypothetical protein
MNKVCLTIFILFLSVLVEAQGPHLNLTGDATEVDGSSFSIDLVNGANQTGGAWYPQSFNLDSSFFIDVRVDFGGLGAEGFAIVLHRDSIPVGAGAEQLGVPNTGESFVVEFDLQQNALKYDASTPHSSFFKNGLLVHEGTNFLQNGTLTDGLYSSESVRMSWDPQSQRFTIKRFGCTNSDLYYIGDIKNIIFEGNSKVFFGFTAATSTVSDKINLLVSYNSAGLSENKAICQGDEIKLYSYNSVPTDWSSNESYTTTSVPYEIIAQPINSGYYKVTNVRFCGTSEDSIWVEVLDTLSLSTKVITVEGEKTVDILLIIEEGESPYTIEWLLPDFSTSTDQDLVGVPFGLYQVTVTNKNQCSSNLEIELIPELIVEAELELTVDPEVETEPETEPIVELEHKPGVSEQDYFSPNGDGEDDYIRINVKGQSRIVGFQGQTLKSVNYGDLWNGTSDDGKLLSSGVYIAIGQEGKQVITILR